MIVDRVKATMSYTHNLGNYESLKLEVGLEATISPEESPEAAVVSLVTECDRLVGQELDAKLRRVGRAGEVQISKMGR